MSEMDAFAGLILTGPRAPDPTRVLSSAVVVTGGGSGLGRAIVLRVAQSGRSVAVWDIVEAKAVAVAEEAVAVGVQSIGLGVDVASRDQVDSAATATISQLGDVGGLACVAGVMRLGTVGDVSQSDWDLCFGVNTNGVLYSVEALLPSLRRVGRGSSIVAVTSTASLRGNPMSIAYTASKHATLGLVRSAALTLGSDGIRVNAVCPGAMNTAMLLAALGDDIHENAKKMQASIALGYISDPAEVANVANFLLSPEASYVSGQAITVNGAMTAN